jgi:predicted ferric reductase
VPAGSRCLPTPFSGYTEPTNDEEVTMLLMIAGILLVLWLLGFLAFHLGAFIHVLIVIAVIVAIVHLVRGRRAGV